MMNVQDLKRHTFCQAPLHYVPAYASLFNDHEKTSLTMQPEYILFENNLWGNFRQLSNRSHFFFSFLGVCEGMVRIAFQIFRSPSSQYFHSLFLQYVPCNVHEGIFASGILGIWKFFHCSGRNPGFEHTSVIVYNTVPPEVFSEIILPDEKTY